MVRELRASNERVLKEFRQKAPSMWRLTTSTPTMCGAFQLTLLGHGCSVAAKAGTIWRCKLIGFSAENPPTA